MATSGRQAFGRLGRLALLIPVVVLGLRFGADWARLVGGISGHKQVLAIAWGAALGAVAMGSMFAPLVTRDRRGNLAGGLGVVLFGWLISTQPYSRSRTNVPLAHLYDRVAPGYVWGLVVAMGVTLLLGLVATGWWVFRLRRTAW